MSSNRSFRKGGIAAGILVLAIGPGATPAGAAEPPAPTLDDEIARQGEQAMERMREEFRDPAHWRRQAERAYHDHLAQYLLLHTRLAKNGACECASER
ncbi:MAG TPA: hypothetical protein ENK54_04965 [Thiotrichales bacterium]|nr:hypothetical protein [Thiotrichales bacterium]